MLGPLPCLDRFPARGFLLQGSPPLLPPPLRLDLADRAADFFQSPVMPQHVLRAEEKEARDADAVPPERGGRDPEAPAGMGVIDPDGVPLRAVDLAHGLDLQDLDAEGGGERRA